MITVDFYHFEDGTNPIDPYLNKLDPKMRAKVFRAMELLEEFGTDLRMPHSEHIEDGIFELRVKFGSNIERVLYFFYVGNKAVMTNGFSKKQQKIPRNELKIAKERRKDYLRRYGNE